MSDFSEALTDGLSGLFDPMGDACTYSPRIGASFAVTAIFARGAQFEMEHSGERARVTIQQSDFDGQSAPAKGDALTFGTTVYVVADDPDYEPDAGLVILRLRQSQ